MAEDENPQMPAPRSGDRLMIGREKIRLLEAVAQYGSISKAAKCVGYSYKTAWDAVNSVNNLMPTPAFLTKSGGKAGGGAQITKEGRSLIETFHRIENRLSQISELIVEEGLSGREEILLWMLGAQISVRNIFQTEIVSIKPAPVDVEVITSASEKHRIVSIVTNSAIEQLGLAVGRRVLCLVKAPFVHLTPPSAIDATSPNTFVGLLSRLTQDRCNSEAILDIGAGKTLTAVAPNEDVRKLKLAVGHEIAARFHPSHVILAVN